MPLSDIPPFHSSLPQLFNLNVFSQLSTLNLFLPLLLTARRHLRTLGLKPLIIIHTSVAGHPYGNLPFTGAYNASKAALSQLTQCLRVEMDMLGIDVLELRTGGVKSSFFANLRDPARVPVVSVWDVDGVKEVVESLMDGTKFVEGFFEREVWARQVVGDVEQGTVCCLLFLV